MKYIAIAAAGLALAACEPVTETTVVEVPTTCDAAPYQGWVGKDADSLANIDTPDTMRIIRPDTAVTLDYNPNRLNVETDRAGIITRVRCG